MRVVSAKQRFVKVGILHAKRRAGSSESARLLWRDSYLLKLLVGQRVDGVFACGEKCRVGCADDCAQKGDDAGFYNPVLSDFKEQRGVSDE